MHDSTVGAGIRSEELLGLVGRLGEPERRAEVAAELARRLGGERLLLFAPDPELGVALPAPGLPQALRGAGEWRAFLARCAREGACADTLPGPDGEPVPAHGCALEDGTAAVLLGTGGAGVEGLAPVLPLLGALFREERRVAVAAARARIAGEAAERAVVLTRTLQEMRERLEAALVEADHARAAARERADQAEALAAELQAQAEQLQEQAVELEMLNDELEARTEEAERARAEAVAANQAKSDFLASMSHELRTPINAVIGYTQLLDLGITGPVTGEQRAQLDRIRASSAHLLSLVNDVLDLAKVEAGRMTVAHEREPLAAVVHEAMDVLEVQAAARGIGLSAEGPDPDDRYVGDRDRVRQILVNLLSNAVKFTDPGGTVTVRCGCTTEPDGVARVSGPGPWTCVSVEDDGIGIAEDELPRVFQPFVQAESGPTRTRGGTGLGLTISRQLARLMGGDLTVRSAKGRGSCFTLWLPAADPVSGEIDPTIRVGAGGEARPRPAGLAEVGERLQAELAAVVSGYTARLRADPAMAEVPGVGEGGAAEHVPVLVADLAALLIRHDRCGGDPAVLWNGSEVQRVIADEHGAERGRQGWGPGALRREFEHLRAEMERVVWEVSAGSPDVDGEGIARVLGELLRQTEDAGLRSLRAVSVVTSAPGSG